MTLSIKETGRVFYCTRCKKRVVGTVHNDMIFFRHGDAEVIFPSGSVKCTGCGHRNHISIQSEGDVVR